MFRAVIRDRVNGIETKTVDVELFEPVKRVVQEEITHGPLFVEGKAAAPRRLMPLGEERFGESVQVISARAEVIVDNVDENHESERVRAIDQLLQIVRGPVRCVRREMRD